MNHTEFSTKTTINDIEKCLDKNGKLYFKIWTSKWGFHSPIFYAFSNDYALPKETLQTLKETPEQFINRLVLITYCETPNKDNPGIFYRLKEITI